MTICECHLAGWVQANREAGGDIDRPVRHLPESVLCELYALEWIELIPGTAYIRLTRKGKAHAVKLELEATVLT
jgi:hypothetical protein